MTGPENYAQAQQLLDGPINVEPDEYDELRRDNLAAAQVHATLALAAAVVAGRAIGPLEGWGGHHLELLSPDREAWTEVTA